MSVPLCVPTKQMNNHHITIRKLALLVAVMLAVWWIGISVFQAQQEKSVTISNEGEAAQGPSGRDKLTDLKMSDVEFCRFKVNLPAPVKKAWTAPLFDSSNFLEPGNKGAALKVLPGWIRKALHAGEVELAASYLWSLKTLAEDHDPKLSSDAVLAIYLLGDFNQYARTKIESWIRDGWRCKTYDGTLGRSEIMDIRARVLRELQFANDRSFDGVIYETWLQTQGTDAEDLESVDYAYYLEKNGQNLPSDYWLQRLNKRRGFTNAFEITRTNATPQVTQKMVSIFEELRAIRPANVDAGRAALAAAASFRLTGKVQYRDYLMDRTREQLELGSNVDSLVQLLEGLATINDTEAFAIVTGAMSHKNTIIQEMAIEALGKSSDSQAADLLFEAAIKKSKSGVGFPGDEMRALLARNEPNADSKYDQLKQALLNGEQGWEATTSDFEVLEFIRNHGRE